MGDVRGMMNLCIPFNAIERIGHQLNSDSWVSYSRRAPSAESIHNISERLSGAIVEVVVELAETNLSTADLIALRVGDIIATETDVRKPLSVSIEGRPKFHAAPGAYKGHKAIQVVGAINERQYAGFDH
jgi:flagellar motor switch protein FliM